MPLWWSNTSSKDIKRKTRTRSFIDAIHRKFKSGSGKHSCKSGGSERFADDTVPVEGLALTRSALPSENISRCQSFSEQSLAQPLPLPGMHPVSLGHADSVSSPSKLELSKPLPPSSISRHGYGHDKQLASDVWGDLATASVSSNSSMDTEDQPDSRLLSPQASDYESGNVTAINSPPSKRNKDHPPIIARRILKEQLKPHIPPSNNHILVTSTERKGPLSSHMTKLHIPPRAGFFSAPDSSISSPSRSPVRAYSHEKATSSGFCLGTPCSERSLAGSGHCSSPGSGQTSGHNSIGGDMSLFFPQSRCSPECSPIPSPKMTSPRPSSRIHSGAVTPLHTRAGGLAPDSLDRPEDGKPQGHRLPLPPVTVPTSSPFSPSYSPVTTSPLRNPGRPESSTSPVSRWKKGRLIGSGTFGHVYVGFNSASGEMCAMKEVTLFLDDSKSKESVQQLGQEITLLSRLRHPNIVCYFGSETVDDKLYIYLEYVSGGSIHKILREYGQLGEPAIRSYTRQILCGLKYLHATNTVHRDIKGANILVDPSGRVKLADFGMAKHITGESCPLSFKGSPYWMAPEVIKNSSGCNLAVDIWSLGCTVIEMATAKPPWSQYEGVAALFKIGNSKELPAAPDHLSEDGKDFVRQCLQRNPYDRPTAVQLLEHPFVRTAASPERSLKSFKCPEPLHRVTNAANHKDTGYMFTFSCVGVDVQLSKSSNNGLGLSDSYLPKHLSCPVSPIGSPLLCPKSSQRRRRAPAILSPHTASGSSTPYTGGSGALPRHHFDHPTTYSNDGMGVQRPPKTLHTGGSPFHCSRRTETLHGIPEVYQANRQIVSSQSNLLGSHPAQHVQRDPSEFCDRHSVLADHVSQQLMSDHLKLNVSPGSSVLGHTNMI